MLTRPFAILGILLALMGFIVAPGILFGRMRRRPMAIHRLHPDESDIPWDLTGWVPLGINDRRERIVKRMWTWSPGFRRVK